jgi:nicotinamidase-related amidase
VPSAALLVIDMQEAALADCVDGAASVVDRVNELVARAKESGAPVVFVQHEDDEFVRGSAGWRLAAALDRPKEATVVEKRYRDGFAATELAELLRRLAAERIVVTGVHSDLCVMTTALSALAHGFDVTFVEDAHAAMPTELPVGTLPAETIEALVNARFAALRYPDRRIEVVPAASVEF